MSTRSTRSLAELDREQGKFSALLMGIVESAPFQKQRRAESVASVAGSDSGACLGVVTARGACLLQWRVPWQITSLHVENLPRSGTGR